MATFFVAPYRPEEKESPALEVLPEISSLRIDPTEYQALLLKKWPGISFDSSSYILLGWFLQITKEGAKIIGGLEEDQQTVFLDTPFDEFFLWHRSIIPPQYELYLFHEGSWDNLELKPNTSLEEIQRFIKGYL